MTYLCPVCKACKKSDLIMANGSCGSATCGAGNSFKDFVERDHDKKTLLDEFAIAAMEAIISKTPLSTHEDYEVNELNSQYNMTAGGAYSYAAAMMKERNLYNYDGTLKEEATEQ